MPQFIDRQYVSPVTGTWAGRSSSGFGASRAGGSREHSGNDLQARNGSTAVAAIGGTVIYAGHNQGYLYNAVVAGDDGNAYRYATHGPLDVQIGQRIEQGQPVGTIAEGHLHFEVIPHDSPTYTAAINKFDAYQRGEIKPEDVFTSTQWYGGKPPTADPSTFFGMQIGQQIVAGQPLDQTGALIPPADIPGGRVPTANAAYAVNFFTDHGYSPQAAAGIVGNLIQESGGPDLNTTIIGDKGQALGIAQWHGDRQQGLRDYAAATGQDWQSLDAQLGYVDYEIQNQYPDVKAGLGAATNAAAAAAAMAGYERAQGWSQNNPQGIDGWGNRLAWAQTLAGEVGPSQGRVIAKGVPPGPDVAALQSQLADRGFYKGKIDGIPGRQTDRAIRNYQLSSGLRVDGKAGPQTFAALQAAPPSFDTAGIDTLQALAGGPPPPDFSASYPGTSLAQEMSGPNAAQYGSGQPQEPATQAMSAAERTAAAGVSSGPMTARPDFGPHLRPSLPSDAPIRYDPAAEAMAALTGQPSPLIGMQAGLAGGLGTSLGASFGGQASSGSPLAIGGGQMDMSVGLGPAPRQASINEIYDISSLNSPLPSSPRDAARTQSNVSARPHFNALLQNVDAGVLSPLLTALPDRFNDTQNYFSGERLLRDPEELRREWQANMPNGLRDRLIQEEQRQVSPPTFPPLYGEQPSASLLPSQPSVPFALPDPLADRGWQVNRNYDNARARAVSEALAAAPPSPSPYNPLASIQQPAPPAGPFVVNPNDHSVNWPDWNANRYSIENPLTSYVPTFGAASPVQPENVTPELQTATGAAAGQAGFDQRFAPPPPPLPTSFGPTLLGLGSGPGIVMPGGSTGENFTADRFMPPYDPLSSIRLPSSSPASAMPPPQSPYFNSTVGPTYLPPPESPSTLPSALRPMGALSIPPPTQIADSSNGWMYNSTPFSQQKPAWQMPSPQSGTALAPPDFPSGLSFPPTSFGPGVGVGVGSFPSGLGMPSQLPPLPAGVGIGELVPGGAMSVVAPPPPPMTYDPMAGKVAPAFAPPPRLPPPPPPTHIVSPAKAPGFLDRALGWIQDKAGQVAAGTNLSSLNQLKQLGFTNLDFHPPSSLSPYVHGSANYNGAGIGGYQTPSGSIYTWQTSGYPIPGFADPAYYATNPYSNNPSQSFHTTPSGSY